MQPISSLTNDEKQRLSQLAGVKRNNGWITRDLKVVRSSAIGRFFFGIFKHFAWSRKFFYNIDLEASRSTLLALQSRVKIRHMDEPDIKKLFLEAAKNFNAIAPRHSIPLDPSLKPSPSGNSPYYSSNYGSSFYQSSSKSQKPLGKSYLGEIQSGMPHGSHSLKQDEKKSGGASSPGTSYASKNLKQDAHLVSAALANPGYTPAKKQETPPQSYLQNIFFTPPSSPQKATAQPVPAIAKQSSIPLRSPPPQAKSEAAPVRKDPAPLVNKAEAVRKKFSKGANLNECLREAIKDLEPESALFYMQKGAGLENIKGNNLKQKELIAWLLKIKNQPKVCPENIDYFAIEMGLGYKTANLMILDSCTNAISQTLKAAALKVPPYLRISDFELSNFLFTALPNLENRWKDFLNTFDPALKKEFLKPANDASKVPLKISESGKAIIEEIQQVIASYFKNIPYYSILIHEWLEQEKPEFIIVRSTGKEDSDTNSNAGGNDSIPFIKPDPFMISEAIGRVIASYFGEKSVGQRLMAGDLSLFNEKEKPFIPVLLQVMIGENVGGAGSKDEDIPRSGVLFTCQQDKAAGVTLINTGLGNNEGVVTSQVEVDSFYVSKYKEKVKLKDKEKILDLFSIHSVVRKKDTRFVAVHENGQYRAEAIHNKDAPFVKAQSLPDEIIKDLKRTADAVSEDYAKQKGSFKPMDMEYTVKLKSKSLNRPIIYLLQARPLLSTSGKEKKEKSFLNLQSFADLPNAQMISPIVLLDGNAWVRKVEKNEEVLFTDDITKALREYTRNPKSEEIKAIIIKKNAPATSHEAVMLRPKGVAVLVVEDPIFYEKTERMANGSSAASPLLIDPQRGLMIAPGAIKDIDKAITTGLISYPIPLQVSLPMRSMLFQGKGIKSQNVIKAQLELLNMKFEQLMQSLAGKKGAKLLTLSKKGVKAGFSIRALFDLMASGNTKDAKTALAAVLSILQKRMRKSIKETQSFRADIHIPMFHAFETALSLASKEVIPALETYAPQTLERLYPIKFLDALVFQQPNSDIISGFSYASVLRSNKKELKNCEKASGSGIKVNRKEDLPLLQLFGFSALSLTPQVSEFWTAFCKGLAQDQSSIKQTLELVNLMNKLGMSSAWMNLCFKERWQTSGGQSKQALKQLQAEYEANRPVFEYLMAAETLLKTLQEQHNQQIWCGPQFAKKNIPKLLKTYQDEFGFRKDGPHSFLGKYQAANKFARLSLLTFMNRAIETYDTLVKDIKGSSAYSDDAAKAKDVAEILAGYFSMMKAVLALLDPSEEHAMMSVKMGAAVYFDPYIKKLAEGTDYKFGFYNTFKSRGFETILAEVRGSHIPNASQLLAARSCFNVNALMVGSKVDLNFGAHWPSTLEEYFTTFHQNMQKVIKTLSTKNGMNQELLAGDAKAFVEIISKRFNQQIAALNVNEGRIQIDFSIPLRQHSALVSLSYSAIALEKGFDIHIEMYGNDETDRWDQSATFGALLAHVDGISFTQGLMPTIDYNAQVRTGVAVSLHVPQSFGLAQTEALVSDLHYMICEMALDGKGLEDPGTYPVPGHKGYIRGLMKQLETRRKVSWSVIDERFFASAFYLNAALMDDFVQAKDWKNVVKIAKGSLIGIARQSLEDYTRQVAPKKLQGYLGDPKYSYVPNNSPGASSLKSAATLHLLQALKENDHAKGVLEGLVGDPLLLKKMPGTVAALKKALSEFKPLHVRFDEALQAFDIVECYSIAIENHKPEWMDRLQPRLAEYSKKQPAQKVAEIYKLLFAKGAAEPLLNSLFKGILQLTEKDKQELQAIKKTKERRVHLNELNNYVNILQTRYNQFDTQYPAIIEASAHGLIGLSQAPSFDMSFGQFHGLLDLLGKPEYNYVFDNQYNDTTKMRKAAPLFIIKAFASPNPDMKAKAMAALSTLCVDYRLAGKNSASRINLEYALFAICRGYYDSMPNKAEAAKTLAGLFQKDEEVLNKLSANPYNIDLKLLKAV